MQITIDLDNPADVRAAIDILPKYLPAEYETSDGSIEKRFIDNLWPRLGRRLRELVKEIQPHPDYLTIEALANRLNRSPGGVKSSLNSPLSRAIKSAKQAVPGAPDLLLWRKPGPVYEMSVTPAMRAALDSKSVESDFDVIPPVE